MKRNNLLILLIISMFLIGTVTFAYAEDVIHHKAKVIGLSGDVQIQRAGQEAWKKAEAGDVLEEGDTIKTADKAVAQLKLIEKGDIVTVDQKSSMTIARLQTNAKTHDTETMLDLAVGSVLVNADKLKTKDSKFEVNTPSVIVGVRGTQFEVKVAE